MVTVRAVQPSRKGFRLRLRASALQGLTVRAMPRCPFSNSLLLLLLLLLLLTAITLAHLPLDALCVFTFDPGYCLYPLNLAISIKNTTC